MKLTVKTLKGSHFKIQVHPSDTIIAVKKIIEEVQGKNKYPWGQQLLIHSGQVLNDETTLEESKVTENGYLVVMVSKSKAAGPTGVSSTTQSSKSSLPSQPPSGTTHSQSPFPFSTQLAPASDTTVVSPISSKINGQAASNLVAGSNVEPIVQQLLEMGGGNWDRNTVFQALHAAYNNPERAVEYLYSGILASAAVAIPASLSSQSGLGLHSVEAAIDGSSPLSGLPNITPLNMFPQKSSNLSGVFPDDALYLLRQNQQFHDLRAMVHSKPQIVQSMLQELAQKSPQLVRFVQEHHAEFLELLNEPVEGVDEGAEGDMFDQAEHDMPLEVTVTPEEQEAIARLEAMGFDHSLVLVAFLACDRDEELAANYLLENAHDED